MDPLSALFYGIIQGASEFLPISSSGHLVLAQHFFGASDIEADYMAFNILLHLATLLAVVGYYIKDVIALIKAFFSMCGDLARGRGAGLGDPWRRLALMIIVSVVPLFFIVPVKDQLEGISKYPAVVGLLLIVTGVILHWSDRLSDKLGGKGREIKDATLSDALIVGIFQAFGTLPGISRSGSTISGGLFRGLDRRLAVRFSFLMSIPAVLGANILSIKDIAALSSADLPAYLLGMAAAAAAGLISIGLINRLARKGGFKVFSIYCTAVGALTVILVLAGF